MGNALVKLLTEIRSQIDDPYMAETIVGLETIFNQADIHDLDDLRLRLVRATWWDNTVSSVSDFIIAVREQI